MVGAGAKPFIAYAILSTTDYGTGDEVIYPNPGFPIYESQIVANGAGRCRSTARKSQLCLRLGDLEELIRPRRSC